MKLKKIYMTERVVAFFFFYYVYYYFLLLLILIFLRDWFVNIHVDLYILHTWIIVNLHSSVTTDNWLGSTIVNESLNFLDAITMTRQLILCNYIWNYLIHRWLNERIIFIFFFLLNWFYRKHAIKFKRT